MTSASAPGKIILFGEHAVVYGRPALAVPVTQVHADVQVTPSSRPGIWIDARDIDLHADLSALPPDHPIAAAIQNILSTTESPSPLRSTSVGERTSRPEAGGGSQSTSSEAKTVRGEGINLTITSTIPVASGLGSGAAVTVALTRALAAFLSKPITDEQVNQLTYEVEKLHHGTPSGVDNTVVTYARPVYFVRGQPIETFRASQPFTIVIADTGVRALTKESVGDVRKLWEADKAKWEAVFDQIGEIAKAARAAIERGKKKDLGGLMNRNHELLQQLTVSSPELDRLAEAACQAGAYGAKLSGGGRGGNMIALVEDDRANAIVEALKAAGAKRVIVTRVGE